MVRTFPARRAILREIRQFIRQQARAHALLDEAESLALAVTEACANAMIHTNCTKIGVTWKATRDRVEIEVEDDGIFRRRVPVPEVDGGGGHRGIPLMMALLDQVSISGGTVSRPGTRVRLVKYRES
ncbi:MAG TPA: ATP-binding protein [Actinomycetota bacterium]|jgi:anti-sigma regulatory factor (Ser/Thr protein kinase)